MTGDPRRPRRPRGLTKEERALWDKVAETIRPLGRRLPPPPADPDDPVPAAARRSPPPPRPTAPGGAPRSAPPLATLEPKLARSLKRGAEVDAKLDLHGLRQDEAHARLVRFLRQQQSRGARIVLVVTGKGGPGFGDERGVLRRQVPAWLAEPALRNVVLGMSEASAAHGGAGALYVRLRRLRG